ncbi:hypothetical protein JCM10450v2_007086 [Rhodotorula kratochvilovae]
MRVVVDAVIKEALEEKAKDLLETMLKPADLDSSLTDLANRQVELNSALHGLLNGLARFKKHPMPYSVERDVDDFVVELSSTLVALHDLLALLAHEPNLPAPTRFNYVAGVEPDWVLSRGTPGTSDYVIQILGESKTADASSANGLFAPIRTFTDIPAGVGWSDIPVMTGTNDKGDTGREQAAGLRVTFSKNLAITLYDLPKALTHVYVSTSEIFFALMVTLSHSSTSASPVGVPYLYILTPLISLGHHGLLLVLYFLATRPDEMRHTVARAIQSAARFAPLRAELARHGLMVSDALPPLLCDVPRPSVGGDNTAPSDAKGSVEPRRKKRPAQSSAPATPATKRLQRDDSLLRGSAGQEGVNAGSDRREGDGKNCCMREEGLGAGESGTPTEGSQRDTGWSEVDRLLLGWRYGLRSLATMDHLRRIPPPPLPTQNPQTSRSDHEPMDFLQAVEPSPLATLPERLTRRITALLPPIIDGKSAMTMYAHDGSMRYVIKMSRAHAEGLRGEAALLARASDAGLSPRFLGLYEEELDEAVEKVRRVVLLMEDGGKALDREFSELSIREKNGLYALVLALHQVGIWHDDLAPRNILINPSGEFRVCDFGRSRLHDCEGEDKCGELEDLQCELELETAGEGGSGVGRAGGRNGEGA